jgi:hypothetical protein
MVGAIDGLNRWNNWWFDGWNQWWFKPSLVQTQDVQIVELFCFLWHIKTNMGLCSIIFHYCIIDQMFRWQVTEGVDGLVFILGEVRSGNPAWTQSRKFEPDPAIFIPKHVNKISLGPATGGKVWGVCHNGMCVASDTHLHGKHVALAQHVHDICKALAQPSQCTQHIHENICLPNHKYHGGNQFQRCFTESEIYQSYLHPVFSTQRNHHKLFMHSCNDPQALVQENR